MFLNNRTLIDLDTGQGIDMNLKFFYSKQNLVSCLLQQYINAGFEPTMLLCFRGQNLGQKDICLKVFGKYLHQAQS